MHFKSHQISFGGEPIQKNIQPNVSSYSRSLQHKMIWEPYTSQCARDKALSPIGKQVCTVESTDCRLVDNLLVDRVTLANKKISMNKRVLTRLIISVCKALNFFMAPTGCWIMKRNYFIRSSPWHWDQVQVLTGSWRCEPGCLIVQEISCRRSSDEFSLQRSHYKISYGTLITEYFLKNPTG